MSARLRWLAGAAAIALALAVWIIASGTAWWRSGELAVLDQWYALRGPVAPSGDIAVVIIDDGSVDALGGWPLPRPVLARVVDRLAAQGASVIAFDLLLTEPTRQVREAEAVEAAADDGGEAYDSQDDRNADLGAAMDAAGRVAVPYAFVFTSERANTSGLPDVIAERALSVVRVGADGPPALPQPAGLIVPAEGLARRAAALGHVSVLLDVDGSLRHDLSVLSFDGLYFPSLPLEVARLHLGIARDDVVVQLGEAIVLGDRVVPVDPTLGVMADFYGPERTFQTYRLIDVLEDGLPDGTLSGRIVMVGASVLGLGDTFSTPYTRTLPGVEFLATVVDNILHDHVLSRPDWEILAELAAILVLGCLAVAGLRAPPVLAAGILAVLVLGWAAACHLAFARADVWLGFLGPAMAVVLVGVLHGIAAFVHERTLRRAADSSVRKLSRYFDPKVASRLAGPEGVDATPQTRQAAIMFVDIAGFTTMAEQMSAEDTHALLQQVHARIDQAVATAGGIVDKYLGDGAMACFGTLAPTLDAPRQALYAARMLVDGIEAWNAERAAAGEQRVTIGIGIHYGPVLVGDVGTVRAAEFTVIGDTVNVASRLESLTRKLAAAIVVSDAAVATAKGCGATTELAGFVAKPPVAIRGRQHKVPIWVLPRPAPAGTGTRAPRAVAADRPAEQ